MTIQQRKSHFTALGKFLEKAYNTSKNNKVTASEDEELLNTLLTEIDRAVHHNGWFTKENVLFSLNQWSKALSSENLENWLKWYDFKETPEKTIGIVMAGNIPLVGFHDFLSVLIAGHKVVIKQSSSDKKLLPVLAKFLIACDPIYSEKIKFTEGKLEGFNAVIATGSNNTSRYFEYYFAEKPSIIRKNRNSVAVLSGRESAEELEALGEDIFRYFGLGCRNVSKLYVPKTYNFDAFFNAVFSWKYLINNAKYANNYDYNKAVYLMSDFKLLDNGFLLLKKDTNFGSPIATLFYEEYESEATLKQKLEEQKDELQCIVSSGFFKDEIGFGETQHPKLWDYADNLDTLAFLQQLK